MTKTKGTKTKGRDAETIRQEVETTGTLKLNNGGGSVSYTEIEETLEAVADSYGVSLWETRSGTWEAITGEAGERLFARGALKLEGDKSHARDPYDWGLLDVLIDWYISLCKKYGKMATPYGFGYMVRVPFDTLADWINSVDSSVVNVPAFRKLIGARDSAIIGRLYDSNQVTGQAMLANNLLGWDTSRNTKRVEIARAEVGTLSENLEKLLGEN